MRRILQRVCMIFISTFILIGCGVHETNEIPTLTPIPASSVDWNYLSKDGNYMRVASIQFSFDSGAGHLSGPNFVEAFKLLNENKDRIFDTEKIGTYKVYLRFGKIGKLSEAYRPDQYDGKECTFYVDKELNGKLEKMFSQ